MTEPLTVSVALCTFNGAEHLPRQLESILEQSRLPQEIVISDDRSTDGTAQVIDAFVPRAEAAGISVTVLRDGSRRGVTGNFAQAIAATGGDVVILSDQDDVWHEHRVARAAVEFERDQSLLLRHEDARLVDGSGADLGLSLYAALGVSASDLETVTRGEALPLYLRRNIATGATMSFRRTLFAAASPLPPEWVHDEWLAVIAAATGRVQASADVLIDYRQHGGNVIGVNAPTLRYKVERMLTTAPDRNRTLAARATVLAERLGAVDGVPADYVLLAGAKAAFEGIRAGLPTRRLSRIPMIMRAATANGYSRFASQGRLDIVRDLLRRGA